jgi:hypothetical protein
MQSAMVHNNWLLLLTTLDLPKETLVKECWKYFASWRKLGLLLFCFFFPFLSFHLTIRPIPPPQQSSLDSTLGWFDPSTSMYKD